MLYRHHLMTRNSCNHPLTSDDINHNRFCAPIHKCIHCQKWFPIVLVFVIIIILVAVCCLVKSLRPKPWKNGVNSVKRGLGYDKPARTEKKGTSGGGAVNPPDRVWPGMEMGPMPTWPMRGGGGSPAAPLDALRFPTRPQMAGR